MTTHILEYEKINNLINDEKIAQSLLRKKLRIKNLKNYEPLGPKYFDNVWPSTILENVSTILGRIGFHGLTTKDYTNEGPILLAVRNISSSKLDLSSKITYITEQSFLRSPNIIVKKNDVLFAKSGTIGTACIVDQDIEKITINAAINIIRSSQLLLPKFILYWFRTPQIQKLLDDQSPNTAQKNLFQRDIRRLDIPVPSLEFQKKIVQKLDDMLGQLEEKKKEIFSLKTRFNSKKIHNSCIHEIIKTTFSGKVTKQFRSKNKSKKINITASLERIFPENIDTILKQDVVLRSKIHYSIPDEWILVTLGDIFDIQMGQSPPGNSYSKNTGVPLLNGPTEFTDTHPIEKQFTNKPTKMCQKNDLLICVRGATTGRMNWADKSYCIGRGIASIRSHKEIMDQKLLFYFLKHKTYELLKNTRGTIFPNMSSTQLSGFVLPLPTKQEQIEILRILESKISKMDKMNQSLCKIENNMEHNIKHINYLQSSILDAAFSGKLVQ